MDNNKIVLISLQIDELQNLISDAVKKAFTVKQEKELLSFKEVCKFLNISASCLNQWKRENKIPYKRLGRRIFFQKSEVMAALEDSNYSRLRELKR